VKAVVAVPRLLARMNPAESKLIPSQWSETSVSLSGLESDDMWTNVLSHSQLRAKNGVFAAQELFGPFPVALLVQE
jgi:maltooligosyltrehalose synthase